MRLIMQLALLLYVTLSIQANEMQCNLVDVTEILVDATKTFETDNEKRTTEKPNKSTPNIILILADDMGFDDVSFRGYKEFLTPNIDALAYHGKILDRMYAATMCTPSRAALMSGRYPIHTGTQHFVISNEEPWALSSNVTTIADVFQRAGYSTNLVGKWHLGYARKEFTPTQRGFDYHYGYWGAFIDYYQRRSLMIGPNSTMGYDFRRNMAVECADRGTYITDLFTNEAERIIAEHNKEKPLFLMLNHLAPHTANEDEPLQAPPDEVAKFAHIADPNRRLYAAMVSRMDEGIGRVVRALENADLLSNSIIIFYSDNGSPVAGLFANSGSNWPLRGQKNTPWEGGVRVAGAIWSPLLQQRSHVYRQPIYVGDWLPTLTAAASIELDKNDAELFVDGINLWPQLSADAEAPLREREIVHNLDEEWNVISYMRGDWKYVSGSTLEGRYDNLLSERNDDIAADPRERRYGDAVLNSLTSRTLQRYDAQPLSNAKINELRAASGVNCGLKRRACYALKEPCLFNLQQDPCEQNNLASEPAYAEILAKMQAHVERYRFSAWPIQNKPGRSEFEPARHQCTWTTFLEEAATKDFVNCNYYGPPCKAEEAV